MSVIGFDTSLATTTACVLRDDGEAFHTRPPDVDRLLGPARHSQELLPELERLLAEAGETWSDVESIAIGVGPGTFTGLRIGVATARALGQSLQVDLKPISSLEALVAPLVELPGSEQRPLLGLIDAKRGQVFVALYGVPPAAATSAGAFPRPVSIWSPAVMDPGALLAGVNELDSPPVCVGDWAVKSRFELEGTGGDVPPSESGFHAVSALHLCRLATDVEAVSPTNVYPVYLRLPDAEITRLALGDIVDGQDR